MTDASAVTIAIDAGVATVSFSSAKANSLSSDSLSALVRAITETSANSSVTCIVLCSEGTGAFCAGASFTEMDQLKSEEEGKQFFLGFAQAADALIRSPQITVARVQGKVVGGGMGLVAACDYAIASRNAAARLSELSVGIGPFVIAPFVEQKIGASQFMAMTVDTAWRDAEWCLAHGLYHRLCADQSELDAEVSALSKQLAKLDGEALREMKRVFWERLNCSDALIANRAGMSARLALKRQLSSGKKD